MDLTKNAQKVLDLVKELSAVELAALVKSLEEEFDVTAASMVVAGGAAGADDDGGDKDAFDIELTEVGGQKIAVIKVVKTVLGLGLKDAKDMVGKAPVVLKEGVKSEEAEGIKTQLEEAGATVTLK